MDKACKLFAIGSRYIHHSKLTKAPFWSKSLLLNPNGRNYSTSSTMKVALLGAAGNLGKSVSLMLKQSSYIDELCLYDKQCLEGFASDLNFIDTKCKGISEVYKDLQNSHLVLIVADCQHSECGYSRLLEKNGAIIKELATSIAKYSPKSVIGISTEPINSIVPMFSEIMKRHGLYNPQSIFGITTIDVIRTNMFVADVLGLEPECVVVPVIGGHTEKTLVPVLSQALPCSQLTNEELEDITNSVKKADLNIFKVKSDGPYLSRSFAIARFAISMVKALRGQTDIVECAYVSSKVHPQLTYMVTPLLLGLGGIAKNLGVPPLTDYEQCLFQNAVPILLEDIRKGEVAGGRPKEEVDGQHQDAKTARCPPDHCEIQQASLE